MYRLHLPLPLTDVASFQNNHRRPPHSPLAPSGSSRISSEVPPPVSPSLLLSSTSSAAAHPPQSSAFLCSFPDQVSKPTPTSHSSLSGLPADLRCQLLLAVASPHLQAIRHLRQVRLLPFLLPRTHLATFTPLPMPDTSRWRTPAEHVLRPFRSPQVSLSKSVGHMVTVEVQVNSAAGQR